MTKKTNKIQFEKIFGKLLAFGALILIYIFFAIFGHADFTAMPTTLNILASSYFVGFMAIGVTFVIITGGIDLSLGTVMICSALVGGLLYREGFFFFSDIAWLPTIDIPAQPLWICLIVIIFVSTTFGLFNGLMVSRLKLPPFISTLGTMMVAQGLGAIITNTRAQTFPTLLEADAWFGRVFLRVGNFPTGLMWLIAYFVIALIILTKTKIGRYTFAIGSNEEAVRLSGVNVANWKCLVYVISGFSVGFGAIFFGAAYMTIIPSTGQGFELQAIAAVVIGGTSLAGGVGSLVGTAIGVFIMSVLRMGLMSMGWQAPVQVFFTGLVVIGAVLLDIQRTKRANQVKKEKKEEKKKEKEKEKEKEESKESKENE